MDDLKLGDKVLIQGTTGVVVCVSGRDRLCIVRFPAFDGTELQTGWLPMESPAFTRLAA